MASIFISGQAKQEVKLCSLNDFHVITSKADIEAELIRNSSLDKPLKAKQLFEKLAQTLFHLCQLHYDVNSLAFVALLFIVRKERNTCS